MNIIAQKTMITVGVTVVVTVVAVRTLGLLGHVVNESFDAIERQIDKTFNRR